MTHATRRLTAKNRDQLRNPTLGNRVWASFVGPTILRYEFKTLPLSRHQRALHWDDRTLESYVIFSLNEIARCRLNSSLGLKRSTNVTAVRFECSGNARILFDRRGDLYKWTSSTISLTIVVRTRLFVHCRPISTGWAKKWRHRHVATILSNLNRLKK